MTWIRTVLSLGKGVLLAACTGTEPSSGGSEVAEGATAPADGRSDSSTDALADAALPADASDASQPRSCFESPRGADSLPDASGPIEVQLGGRDPTTGTDFVAFDEGCGIPIGGIGQAGLTARFALRVRDSEPLERAYVALTLLSVSDPEREPANNNGQGVVRALDCRADGWCYLVPLLVEISHLNRLPDLEGTVVTFSVEVTAADDQASSGTLYGWGAFVLEAEAAGE